MDYSRAWHTIVDDQNWLVKVLIGGIMVLISPLIIPALFVGGYFLDVMQRAAQGEDSLPEWTDWGRLLVRGLMWIAIQFIYSLPIVILGCCMATVGLLAGQGSDARTMSDGANALMACLICLIIPIALIVAYVTPAAILRYATEGEIGAAFDFNRVFGLIRENLGPYTIAVVLGILIYLVVGLISTVTCGIGLPWLSFFGGLLFSSFIGQVAWLDRQRRSWGGGAPSLPAVPMPPVG